MEPRLELRKQIWNCCQRSVIPVCRDA